MLSRKFGSFPLNSKRFLHITALKVPNPLSKKFVVEDREKSESIFQKIDLSGKTLRNNDRNCPQIFKPLLQIRNLDSVYIGKNFVTISVRNNEDNGDKIWAEIFGELKNIFTNFDALQLSDSCGEQNKYESADKDCDDKEIEEIERIIDEKIRPFLEDDGGDIELISYKEKRLMLKFKGSCDGCPSSGETLKYGIENLLKHYFPQIETIEVMNNDIEHLNHKEYEEFIRKLRDKNNDENNGC